MPSQPQYHSVGPRFVTSSDQHQKQNFPMAVHLQQAEKITNTPLIRIGNIFAYFFHMCKNPNSSCSHAHNEVVCVSMFMWIEQKCQTKTDILVVSSFICLRLAYLHTRSLPS